MDKNLTDGSITGRLVTFSLPYLLSYFLQTLYGMADLIIIGHFGTVADTAAVSVGSQVMHMITVIIVGLAMGSTVCMGRAVGGGEKKKSALFVGNSVTLFALFALAFTAVLLLCRGIIISAVSTPAESVAGAWDYLTVCFIGVPFITAYNVICSILRGMGDSKSSMYFVAVACAFNIVLDIFFMGTLSLGPLGAALGTVLSQALSVVLSLIFMRVKKSAVTPTLSDLRPRRTAIGGILSVGLPIALQDGLIQVSFMVITAIANRRGLTDAAAVGIVEKIIGFLFLVPSSMLSSVSVVCSHNLGAAKQKRAELTLRCALIISALYGVIAVVLSHIFAESTVGFFTDAGTQDGAQVVKTGAQYLHGYSWDCIFAGIHFCFSGYFCACGRSVLSFFHNITAIAAVRIPGAYFTSVMFADTLLPMGLATAAGSLVSAVICVIMYFTVCRRKEKAVI